MVEKFDMKTAAQNLILNVFEKCAGKSGCDVCRLHMEEDCLFFPELYRLNDKAKNAVPCISSNELSHLLDLCTLCGLCPCQDIRMLILQAKSALADHKSVPFFTRMLSDPEKIGRWGTRLPKTANCLGRVTAVSPVLKQTMKIHPGRDLPVFPRESFFSWAKKRGLNRPKDTPGRRSSKVAYFAGCSAGYLFPEVGKAAAKILERNRIDVFVPHQECCGMPLIMEGRRKEALKRIQKNVETFFAAIQNGYDIVCSCPTCGYFFKKLLLETAYYSDAFQTDCGVDSQMMKVPTGSLKNTFSLLPGKIYKTILKDNGYFSVLDPLKRIELSKKVMDLGEYLLSIFQNNTLDLKSPARQNAMAYYAPCHQREQDIGHPYYTLLKSHAGSDIVQIGSVMDCCGMAGHLGYKADFYPHAQKIGTPLFEKFLSQKDRTIVTDCLSCKLQFQHVLPMDVFHPLELI